MLVIPCLMLLIPPPVQEPSAADAPPAPDSADVARAGALIGLDFDADELELMTPGVVGRRREYAALRERELANSVAPAFSFSAFLDRLAQAPPEGSVAAVPRALPEVTRPGDLEELCFADIPTLAALIETRQVSCLELTDMYLARLERIDAQLACVVTLMPERARAQARRLDAELEQGRWRGLLHGIPWGAKDLLAARGAPTTWGAAPFRDQAFDHDATVVRRLEDAGAVLIAKLSLGALAWGDVWFGGTTRNPWDTTRGSSGSSAGPASATAAGGVAFAIGSETYGSIVSPSVECRCSSLRPSFGTVSRHGAMALSWTMDKLGPMCRSIGDAAIVMEAIAGADPLDDHALDRPFTDLGPADVRGLRVGYLEDSFPDEATRGELFGSLEALGAELVEVALPYVPVRPLMLILTVEAAAAFDDLTRSGRDDELTRQVRAAWPNVFREARLIPAVEYVNANRVRRELVHGYQALFAGRGDEPGIDVLVHESQHPFVLAATNLTGHPTAVVPAGRGPDGLGSVSFTGGLFDDARLVAFAEAWQRATGHHDEHPRLAAPEAAQPEEDR